MIPYDSQPVDYGLSLYKRRVDDTGDPTTSSSMLLVRSDITVLTGGTSNALDAVPTTGLLPGVIIKIVVTGQGSREFVLQVNSDDDTDADLGIIRPLDNETHIWRSIL